MKNKVLLTKFKNKYRIETTRLRNWDYSSNGIYFITICTQNRRHYFGKIIHGEMQLSGIGRIAYNYFSEISNHYPFAIVDEFVVMPDHVHGIIIIKQPETENENVHDKTTDETKNVIIEPHDYAAPNDNKSRNNEPHDYAAPNENMNRNNETHDYASSNDNEIRNNETHDYASRHKTPTPNKFGPQSKNIPAIIRGYKSAVKKYATMNNIEFSWQSRYHDHIIRSRKELRNVRVYIRNNPMKWEIDRNN